ncbi:hypothetical protein J437_LFUL009103 [Ladona fulva]|uniref:Golgi membrane protein 1 n=1 Tax=Ladona fulva TaxID=123851 RepID=A0A8K0K4Y4_LADFU|nr:hypothetical protein J437_LFUL009103 [Ladona fulva]
MTDVCVRIREMGIEHMRGNYGRCPPFLFGGLVLVCLIITVNWWSLSTQNNDLIRQLEDLGEKFKFSSDQREQCLQLRMVLDNRLKNTEEELAQVRVRLEKMKIEINKMKAEESRKDDELKSIQKNSEDFQNTASLCTSELESLKKVDISKDATIASLRIEKDKYSEKDLEIAKLRNELEEAKQEIVALKTGIEASKASIPVEQAQRSQLKKQPLVEVHPKGMGGMLFHEGSIIVSDPPNAPRPKPRVSVTYMKGNQGGELDDNHGGEREEVDDLIPNFSEKLSKEQAGKKTRNPVVNNSGNNLTNQSGILLSNNLQNETKKEVKIENLNRSPETSPAVSR